MHKFCTISGGYFDLKSKVVSFLYIFRARLVKVGTGFTLRSRVKIIDESGMDDLT